MSDDIKPFTGKVKTLLQHIALELAFVDPVQESGVDGIHDLLTQLTELLTGVSGSHGTDTLDVIRLAQRAARRWIDERIADDSRLTAETIQRLHEWQPWMESAVTAWEYNLPCPTLPDGWQDVAPTVAPLPSKQPTSTQPTTKASVSRAIPALEDVEEQLADGLAADADQEMVSLFCSSAQDLLQDIEQGVLVLEENPNESTTIDTVFRAFHTFKGNAGVMNFVVLQRLTHELESLLDAARRGTFQLGRESIDLILQGADILKRYVTELSSQLSGVEVGRKISLPIPSLVRRAHRMLTTGSGPVPAKSSAPVVQNRAPASVEIPAISSTTVQPIPTPVFAAAQPVASPEPPAKQVAPTKQAPASSAVGIVRVDTLKLDGLIDLVGELVIAQSMVVQNPDLKNITSEHLSRSLGQLRGITSDLQRTAMSLRMVPIRNTFQKMARLVRDLAAQQGKEIQLVLEGEDTELDRNIVEELSDPLIHMIRNSADHGIEATDRRIADGKPRAGTITLRAFHQGGFIVIQIQDDGKGLVPDRILAKAVERGLVKPDNSLDEQEIFELIFAPGFSTAEQITDVSGRGVGMDVVRRNIEKMRGKIEIQSVAGAGTTFTLFVPLTLAIIEGLLVGVGDQRYIIPTLSVRESFRPLPGMVTTVHGRGEMVHVRGRLTPMLRLGDHLHTPVNAVDPTQGIVVVVEAGQDSRCLLVDELIGKQEVVIKSLGEMFHNQTAFAGAAILGDGRVGLILDIHALVKLKLKHAETAA
ncbi:MAG: chemotaxis protein CheA [Planctomycetaceae bacterium]|nr:MAG: chemotaxis protein CheA [Planctomycetaceae bacterium]